MSSKTKLVRMIVGKKVWECSMKMAETTINIGIEKYKKENVNIIVGVKKGRIISLLKEQYETQVELDKAVSNYSKGGYIVHYTTKTEEVKNERKN